MGNILKKMKSKRRFGKPFNVSKKSKSSSKTFNGFDAYEDFYPGLGHQPVGFKRNSVITYVPEPKRKDLPETPTVLINDNFKSKVDFLHKKVGTVEWSGVLVYKIVEGSIENPSKFVVEVVDIILMDIGSATYTEYSLADAISKDDYVFERMSDIMMDDTLKVGHIHTH